LFLVLAKSVATFFITNSKYGMIKTDRKVQHIRCIFSPVPYKHLDERLSACVFPVYVTEEKHLTAL